jgi:hypothetical protein
MTHKVVLGIHSQVDPNAQGSVDQLTSGHAWISVTRGNNPPEYYGLWPDAHPRFAGDPVASDPNATDIRRGIEGGAGFNPTASRYYELTPEQATNLEARLRENVTWGYTNTCASWASETVSKVTGQNVSASEYFITGTPRELIRSINELERTLPTSPSDPVKPSEINRSSSFGALDAPAGTQYANAALVAEQPLHVQAKAAVGQLDAQLGRVPDANSDRMAASAALLAGQSGLERIDHVVLSTGNDRVKAGENMIVMQGGLNDPARLSAHMKTSDALAAPVEQSLSLLASVNTQPYPAQRQEMDQPIQVAAPHSRTA